MAARRFEMCNARRPHATHGFLTPNEACVTQQFEEWEAA